MAEPIRLRYNPLVKLKLLFLPIFLFLSLFIFIGSVFAQEKINNFDVLVIAHKDGTMTIKENIDYDFGTAYRHGIFRYIPLVSRVGDLYRVIKIDFDSVTRDEKTEKYEVDRGSKQTEVKIGDPDKTITGVHNYIIIYTVKNGIGSNYADHDEIYWNVTGSSWEIPIEKASFRIETDFSIPPLETICFTGPQSSKFQDCRANENSVSSSAVLEPYQGLTTVTKFPVNTFPKSVLQKSEPVFDPGFLMLLKIYFPIALGLNFLLAPYLLFWYFKNKSRARLGPPSVNFDIPKNLSPAEAGIIDNAKLEQNDVIATIFDLAIRKYLKIEEVKIVKVLRPDETDYKIIKLKSPEGLNSFEKILYDRFFESGDIVSLKDLKTDFYLTFESLENKVFSGLAEKKLYTKNPKNQMGFLLVLGIIVLVLGNIILGPVLLFLSKKLNGRTPLGDKIDWEVDGLKIFLKAMSRHYKFQTKNLITVEKYIPYAIALGLQAEFMEQLKIINPDYEPNWYSGTHGFYYIYPGMYSSFGSNMTTSAPSSSSGFSGGSSGGGGGGGGGGSW